MVVVNFAPAPVDLTGIRAGDRNLMRVTVTSGGAPWDLTGAAVAAQARLSPTDATAALVATCTITDAANGVVEVQWSGTAVRTLLGSAKAWNGVWDLQVTPFGAEPLTVAAGRFQADLDVTRP